MLRPLPRLTVPRLATHVSFSLASSAACFLEPSSGYLGGMLLYGRFVPHTAQIAYHIVDYLVRNRSTFPDSPWPLQAWILIIWI
ncbi:hypothetical protein PSPO01_12974 [Paraphaeosphaeria sporulosa]